MAEKHPLAPLSVVLQRGVVEYLTVIAATIAVLGFIANRSLWHGEPGGHLLQYGIQMELGKNHIQLS